MFDSQYPHMSKKDADRIRRINAKNGWGITYRALLRLCREHEQAFHSGDLRKMEMIEYRLEDINFHSECAMLSNGEYFKARQKIRAEMKR